MDGMERPTTIAWAGGLRPTIEEVRRRGAIRDDMVIRVFIGTGEASTVAIDPSLQVTLTPEGGGTGDYDGEMTLGALASREGQVVWIIAESVPAGAYRDAFPVTVVRNQSG